MYRRVKREIKYKIITLKNSGVQISCNVKVIPNYFCFNISWTRRSQENNNGFCSSVIFFFFFILAASLPNSAIFNLCRRDRFPSGMERTCCLLTQVSNLIWRSYFRFPLARSRWYCIDVIIDRFRFVFFSRLFNDSSFCFLLNLNW